MKTGLTKQEKTTDILAVSDCTSLDAEIDRLSEKIEAVAEMVKSCVNACGGSQRQLGRS